MEPSASARRFEARLQLYKALLAIIRGVDTSDVMTVLSLVLLFVGLTVPSIGAAVVGGLLVLLTPIGTALRVLIRGR